MENKNVGYLIIGISVLIIIIILLFNSAMTKIVDSTCSAEHGPSCPMYESIDQQTYLSLSIVGLLIIIGVILILSKPQEKIIIKKVKERQKKIEHDLSNLKSEERKVFSIIEKSKGIFQADLIDQTGFGKAKMTRILDRLEGQGFVERKRRGMTNIVLLKQ